MTSSDLRAWQTQMGYQTQQHAAAALGVSWATYKRWLSAPEVPRLTALACAALAAGLDDSPKSWMVEFTKLAEPPKKSAS